MLLQMRDPNSISNLLFPFRLSYHGPCSICDLFWIFNNNNDNKRKLHKRSRKQGVRKVEEWRARKVTVMKSFFCTRSRRE